jgi:phosphohistidine phosphatase
MSPPRQLIVMRHAKTEPFHSDDRSRRLTDRGEADARAAGVWLAEAALVPDVVLVSPAVRARQTVERVADGAGEAPDVRVVDDLYGADVDDVLDMVHHIHDEPDRMMLVGHNPTMAELVWALEQDSESDSPGNLPTSGIVALEFDQPWSRVTRDSGRVSHRFVPRG